MKRTGTHALRLTSFLGVALALAGCGSSGSETKPAETAQAAAAPQGTLYDRLGGKPAITAVVDDFVNNLLADDAIKIRFRDTDVPHFKELLTDQICEASGGPCKYAGKNMKDAHAGMKISDAEFGALVGDLKKSLAKFKVPAREQGELLTALGGMQPDVVNQ